MMTKTLISREDRQVHTIENGHTAFEIFNLRINEVSMKVKVLSKTGRETKDRCYRRASN